MDPNLYRIPSRGRVRTRPRYSQLNDVPFCRHCCAPAWRQSAASHRYTGETPRLERETWPQHENAFGPVGLTVTYSRARARCGLICTLAVISGARQRQNVGIMDADVASHFECADTIHL